MVPFSITSGAVKPGARVLGFRGFEALSTPFEFEVFVNVEGDGADLEDGVGANAVLHLRPELPTSVDLADPLAVLPHDYAGILWETEVLRVVSGRAVARLLLVPHVTLLKNSHHSRVWQGRSIDAIFRELLEGYGLADGTDFDVMASGPTEEHVCQYEESDLDFIHRWIEREGWVYYFDHRGGTDKLVITDRLEASDVRGVPARYVPEPDRRSFSKNSFAHFSYASSAQPRAVTLLDHDYARPTQPVTGSAEVAGGVSASVVRWGNRAFTDGDASRLAGLRAELHASLARRHLARGGVSHLTSGFGFSLSEHPRAALNDQYVVISARHLGRESPDVADVPELAKIGLGEGGDVYRVEVECQPASVPYRTPARTRWPVVTGFQNATVDGAGGPYAPVDDVGRYDVRFHFDENSSPTGKASTKVRMAQPHGGPNEGLHFPLRASTEVLCAFLGGDPDCPVIVGASPNATKPSTVVEANLSQNVVQTGSGSYLVVEDKAGAEFMNLFTPAAQSGLYLGTGRDDGGRGYTANASPAVPPVGPGGLGLGPFSFDLRTDEGHGQVHSGGDMCVIAGGDYQLIAGDHSNLTYQAHLDYDVLACVDEDYHAELTVCVEGQTDIDYENELDSCVTGDATEFYRDTVCVDVTSSTSQDFGSTLSTTVVGEPWTTMCVPPYNVRVSGDATDTVVGSETVEVSAHELVEIDGNLEETITSGNYELTMDSFDLKVGNVVWHTVSELSSTDVTGVQRTQYGPIKVDIVLGAHLEIWPLHNEQHYSLNASVTGLKAEVVGVKTMIGYAFDNEDDLPPQKEITGVKGQLALVNVQAMSAASLKNGGARLAQHLLSLII